MPFRLFKRAEDTMKRFDGRMDLVEGIIAFGMCVASADGTISENETGKIRKKVSQHPALQNVDRMFIEQTITKYRVMIEDGGRSGRRQLKSEIFEAAKSEEDRVLLVEIALDIADENGIDDAELKVIKDIAGELGVSNVDQMI
jgi:tellurite resistance protein